MACKTLKANIRRNIASVLSSDNPQWKSAKNIVLFARVISVYPSKSPLYSVCERLIHFTEQNIRSVSLVIETMRDEGEDPEIISMIESLREKPTITTSAEVLRLCTVLADYVKYAKVLKVKDSFLGSLDLIDEDDVNIKESVEKVYKLAVEIVNAYDSAAYHEVAHSFDTNNLEQMRNVMADAKDSRSADKTIVTGIRGLNNLLSPGYLSGCLYIYAALPGCYKSGILLESHVDTCKYNEHIKNTTNGKTPISMYISMENTMTQTVRRLWAILFPNADLSMFTVDETIEMIERELTSKGFRSVILYYGYREKSTADLYEIIRGYNDDKHVVVALYLDYIKRIRSARTDAAAMQSEKSELHAIMNELKTIASQFDIPVVSGHQLNRAAAQAIDDIRRQGGFNKASEALGRSHIGTAWEIMEVADWLAEMNIENNGETKMLYIDAVKQRDVDSNGTDVRITTIRHPFLSPESFALRTDMNENCSISIPVYHGQQQINYMANI
jgi:replicative DNA helicase